MSHGETFPSGVRVVGGVQLRSGFRTVRPVVAPPGWTSSSRPRIEIVAPASAYGRLGCGASPGAANVTSRTYRGGELLRCSFRSGILLYTKTNCPGFPSA